MKMNGVNGWSNNSTFYTYLAKAIQFTEAAGY